MIPYGEFPEHTHQHASRKHACASTEHVARSPVHHDGLTVVLDQTFQQLYLHSLQRRQIAGFFTEYDEAIG